MKNLIKFGFMALALSVSLVACDFGKPKKGDQNLKDSTAIDSPKVDSLKADTSKNPVDTTKKAEKK
ncbi:hypothetical protein VRU48_05905 [Pedobacter sp. KR3-3]|uniref:Lipoprotein n=1 Tax=Pedobacter albus TaxID=3113905 RepID=A0ABU7I5J3_9SPHI|nr:hypothetical protein [Pedobacter sp. KR3-3]MEE1944632.1 hypothetical protein [Pedobacter sp. KR3-3]